MRQLVSLQSEACFTIFFKPLLTNEKMTLLEKYTDFFKKVNPLGLSIFRILYHLVVLKEVLFMHHYKEIVYDKIPFLVRAEIGVNQLFLFWIMALVFIILGFFTRIATIINYLFVVLIFSGAKLYEYHIFYTYVSAGFLCMFLPLNYRLSIDSIINKDFKFRKVNLVNYLAIPIIGIGLVYWDSIFHKIDTRLWMTGLGMWMPASLPYAVHNDTTFILNIKPLVVFLNYFVIVFEFLFVFLLFIPRLRIILAIIGIIFHLGIFIQYPIPYFATAYMFIYLLLFPAWFWEKADLVVSRFPTLRFLEPIFEKFKIQQGSISIPDNFQKQLWTRFFIVCAFIQVIVTWFSPFPVSYRKFHPSAFLEGATNYFFGPIYDIIIRPSVSFLGITHHGVFVDAHFRNFNHGFKLEYVDPSGNKTLVPLYEENGMVGSMNSGITWRDLSFNIVTPYLDANRIQKGLKPYLWHYMVKDLGVPKDKGTFLIYVKHVDVPWQWKKDHLRNQMAKPWELVGDCHFEGDELIYHWNDKMNQLLRSEAGLK